MKSRNDTVTDLVNAGTIEEVPELPPVPGESPVVEQMAISIAISMKRIADAMPNMSDPQLTINVEQLAWAAGRSFEHGRRTDR